MRAGVLPADAAWSWGRPDFTFTPTHPQPHPTRRERLSSKSGHLETWNFPGWGSYDMQLSVSEGELRAVAAEMHRRERPRLLEWEATAICANDILSSCLYVIGLVVAAAGKMAPVALLLVSCFLYLLRFMYGEAISALPMNGAVVFFVNPQNQRKHRHDHRPIIPQNTCTQQGAAT